MALRSLSVVSEMEDARERPYINTGNPIDLINGKFIPGVNGEWILSGGLGPCTGVIGKGNSFKSTLMNGSAVNAMARFPESQFFLYDSELSVTDRNRLARMSNLYLDEPDKRKIHLENIVSRIKVSDPTTKEGENLDCYIDFLKDIKEEKIAHYKDYEVETEIVDFRTSQPYRMLLPTFSNMDSWTEAMVRQLVVKNDEFDGDTEAKDQKTMFMEEGWHKKRLMRQLPRLCAQGGIYLSISGHLGKKINMGNTPNTKDIPYMGQDETVKAMGNEFYFLMSSILKISNTRPVLDKNDKRLSDYPSETDTSGVELQELDLTLVRSKNSPSGFQTQLISSQSFGILNGLSYYNFLRNNKYYGLGSPNKVYSPLLEGVNLGRTKIFDQALNYKIQRALELTYQLFAIQSTWSLRNQPVDFSIPIEEFAKKLSESTYAADDILNSRGWWTYKGAPGIDRPFLSLPDILNILSGSYKPKFIAVSSSKNGKV